MFVIDKENNQAISIEKKNFCDFGFKERQHLQEWIAKNTEILGEELLIIQKEFSGFSDTKERLDLLAIDKYGSLVIIENKLDDSGKDVAWQALKYVSYCSSLSKTEIRDIYQSYLNGESGGDAQENITSFLDKNDYEEVHLNSQDQRIILVAAKFRKEVTSTVMWLLDHDINITCIKVTPYQMDGQVFLDTDQILPPLDTEDYRIKIANKKKEETKTLANNKSVSAVRYKFWKYSLPVLRETTGFFMNINPNDDCWISGATGISGVSYNPVIAKGFSRVEIYIDFGDKELNEKVFDRVYALKESIEEEMGFKLIWDRVDNKKVCKIYMKKEISLLDEDNWEEISGFLCKGITKYIKVFTPKLKEIVKDTKKQ